MSGALPLRGVISDLARPDLTCPDLTPGYVSTVLLKVYCSDHTYTTIRVAVAATGREVISAVADKLGTAEELLLVHLSSAGGGNQALIRLRCA